MYAGDPDTFAIGSVTFTTVTKFNQQMAAKFDAYVRRDGSPLETEIDEGLLADARHYFDGFTWVGEVKVLNCDAGTSKMRGQLDTSAKCPRQSTTPTNGEPRCRRYCSSPNMTGLRCSRPSVSYRQSTVTLLGRLTLPGKASIGTAKG